jgi:hypothetical protein
MARRLCAGRTAQANDCAELAHQPFRNVKSPRRGLTIAPPIVYQVALANDAI